MGMEVLGTAYQTFLLLLLCYGLGVLFGLLLDLERGGGAFKGGLINSELDRISLRAGAKVVHP